ncbi:hypothetical protein V1264_014187 [Littorina saxatilis]|uniref:DUF229 domain containing protein n=1 Tax=Littorina saxatilis TaxID=31220 RepID=A0AAN9BV97_9CAEN
MLLLAMDIVLIYTTSVVCRKPRLDSSTLAHQAGVDHTMMRPCLPRYIPRRWFGLLLLSSACSVLLLLYRLIPSNVLHHEGSGTYVYTLQDDARSFWGFHKTTGSPGHNAESPIPKSSHKCIHRVLNPSDPSVMEYHVKVGPIKCPSDREDWVYVTNGSIHILPRAQKRHGKISCTYTPIVRDGDFAVRRDPVPGVMQDGQPLQADFFSISCKSESGKNYENVHSAVARNKAVQEHLDRHAAERKKTSSQGLGLSVFMYGFDSMSRMAWLRNLPQTRDYLVHTLGGVELEGYNIVGDGTPAALLPILTGKMEEELPEARRGFPGATPVDGHPWVWKDFSRHGYVTAWAEDMVGVGTFQYRMLGFKEQPTDHNMRPFYLAAEKEYSKNEKLCLGSTPRHVNFMRWFRNLFDTYRNYPKFFFGFHSELSHGGNNDMQAQDEDVKSFLEGLEESGHLNSTLLILMSDHGARFGHIRATAQGKLEERMPYFSFRFPPWFRRQHPDIMRSLETNVHRLTTPFDVHETFLEVLNYTGSGQADIKHRGVSIFKEISKDRTCVDAEVTPHWCACLDWENVSQSDRLVVEAARAALATINELTQKQRGKCVELAVSNITRGSRYVCTEEDSRAQDKILKYWNQYNKNDFGRFDGMSCRKGISYFQVSFITQPGGGHFEAICYHDVTSGTFRINSKEMSRINKYGSQPACIQGSLPHLRPYCYCKEQS